MSLADIYREQFGEPEVNGQELDKEAADAALNQAIEALTEEEAEKLAQVIEVLEEENVEFDHDLQKLAAAAEIVDEYDEYQESEKEAAAEIEAGGRLFARAMVDELSKLSSEEEEKPEEKEEEKKAEEEPKTLSEKLFGKPEEASE
jgi:hypothetical protein